MRRLNPDIAAASALGCVLAAAGCLCLAALLTFVIR